MPLPKQLELKIVPRGLRVIVPAESSEKAAAAETATAS